MEENKIIDILYDDSEGRDIYSLDDPLKIGLFTHLIDSQNLLHSHTYWEFFYITRGTALHHIDNNHYWLLPGKMYIIKPGSLHSLVDYQSKHLAQHRDICISDEIFQKSLSSIPEIAKLINENTSSFITIPFPQEAQSFFENKLSFYENCNVDQKITIAPFIINFFIAQIIQNCFRIQTHIYDEKFSHIMELAHDKTVLEQGLPALVRLSAYSRSQLHRLFIKNTNKTPLDVITDLRMETAATLLVSTDTPLALIAETLGYNSLGHFTKIFKKYYLLTPYKYRSANR